MKYFSNKKGFTLVELMVVIAIIAILTAIVTANFAQSKAKARDAKRISDLAQIQLTLEMAFDRCNVYPASIQNSGLTSTLDCANLNLGYFISKIPTDNGVDYVYGVDSSKSNYILKADLETNSSALVDAYSTNNTTGYSVNGNQTAINCSGRPNTQTQKYEYCVTPK